MGFQNHGNFGEDKIPSPEMHDCCGCGLGDDDYEVPSVPLVLAPEALEEEQAAAEAAEQPDPSEQYSKYFTLRQLTVTSLPYPNLPLDSVSQDNLRRLAALLDTIKDKVGDFVIASAYRSPENQNALRSGAQGDDASSMAVKNSYHSQGIAADITPKNGMTPQQFAAALYTTPEVNKLIGQITDKSEGGNQSSLHISIQTSRFPKATLMYVGDDKQYYRMTASEVQSFLTSFQEKVVAAIEENPEAAVGVGVGTLAAIGAGVFFLLRYLKRK
jgi:hypothetical protein